MSGLSHPCKKKVKQKVKALLEQNAGDKSKEMNRKHLIQKVMVLKSHFSASSLRIAIDKVVFDELVSLVDPGVEPYKPKKGSTQCHHACWTPGRYATILPSSVVSNISGKG